MVDEHRREAQERFFQRGDVALRSAAETVEHLERLDLANHTFGGNLLHRREAERDVLPKFGVGAAVPDHHERAEFRVAVAAQNDFDALFGHLFDQNRVDFRARNVLFDVRVNLSVSGLRGVRAVDVQDDPARVELVFNVGGHHLHNDFRADLRNDFGGFVGARRDSAREKREVVASEEVAAVGLRQVFFVGVFKVIGDDRFRFFEVAVGGREVFAAFERAELGQADVSAERGDGVFREGVVRNALRNERVDAFFDVGGAHERADDRFAAVFDRFRNLRADDVGVGHRLRRQDDEPDIDVRVGHDEFRRDFVTVAVRVAEDVDRVAQRRGGRHDFAEFRFRFFRNFGEFQTVFNGGVGRHDAGAAGVRDDGEAFALRRRLRRVERGAVEKFGDRVDALDARLRENGVVNGVRTGERTGVAADRFRAFGAAPGFQAKDNFALFPEDFRRDINEAFAVRDIFEIHRDRLRFRVVGEVFEEFRFVDVRFVPERHELAEAHLASFGEVENGGAERARLRNERERAFVADFRREAGVQTAFRVDDAEAVRADERNPGFARFGGHRFFDFRAFMARFFEARRDNDHRLRFFGDRVVDDARDELRVDENDDQIDFARNFRQRSISRQTFDFAALRVDRVNGAFEVFDQVEEDVVTDDAFFRRSADDGDGLRIEHTVDIGETFLRQH